MKTYKDNQNFEPSGWLEVDNVVRIAPPWSCYCIMNWDSNHYHTPLKAYKHCENCLGYGFMPIPPSELWK